MERSDNLREKKLLLLIYSMYIFGVFGHLYYPLTDIMLTLTPFTLLFLGILIIISTSTDKKFISWLVITYLVTLTLEIIGVKTGLVFGAYNYGNVLGLKLLEVPIVIGLNWVIIIWGCILIAKKYLSNSFLIGLASAILAVIFDIILEPIAIKFGYWNWSNIDVPLHNYIAWFLIAFFFSYFFSKFNIETKKTIPIHYLIVQFMFFFVLNIFLVWT